MRFKKSLSSCRKLDNTVSPMIVIPDIIRLFCTLLIYLFELPLINYSFVMGSPQQNEVSLEEQFIVRLPLKEAQKVREMFNEKKNNLKITFNPDDNKVKLDVAGTALHGRLKKLPTIIESHKTNLGVNKSTLYKVADVCHIVECNYEENPADKTETSHGYSPPLKNAKKKRFRKTKVNKNNAQGAEDVSNEVRYLLKQDLEAVSSSFDILYEDNAEQQTSSEQSETLLFGELSSDFELSENSH